MVRVGDRPWFPLWLSSIEMYANRIGADLVLHRFCEPSSLYRDWLGSIQRSPINVSLRFLKLFYLREALSQYDKVLLLDDSCYVDVGCPNIFDACSVDCLGAVEDGGLLGKKALPDKIVNTGVLVVSQPQISFFEGFEEFYGKQNRHFDDQVLQNQTIRAGSLQYQPLDQRYNWVGSQFTKNDISDPYVFIYHITGYHNYEQRLKFSRTLSALDM